MKRSLQIIGAAIFIAWPVVPLTSWATFWFLLWGFGDKYAAGLVTAIYGSLCSATLASATFAALAEPDK